MTVGPAPSVLTPAAVALFTAIFSSLAAATLWIWRHTVNVSEYEQVEELETQHRDTATQDIVGLLVKLIDTIESDEPVSPDEIRRIVEESNIDDAVDRLNSSGTARQLHEAFLMSYEAAYKHLGLASIGTLTIAILVVIVAATGGNPFSWAWDLAHGVIGIYSAVNLYNGIRYFQFARECESRFNSLTDGEDLVEVEPPKKQL